MDNGRAGDCSQHHLRDPRELEADLPELLRVLSLSEPPSHPEQAHILQELVERPGGGTVSRWPDADVDRGREHDHERTDMCTFTGRPKRRGAELCPVLHGLPEHAFEPASRLRTHPPDRAIGAGTIEGHL